MVKLGSTVRDAISGFTGIVTGRTEYLYGCVRIHVTPAELKDGKPVDEHWFDEQRIEVLSEIPPYVSPQSSALAGGPQNDPAAPRAPTR